MNEIIRCKYTNGINKEAVNTFKTRLNRNTVQGILLNYTIIHMLQKHNKV